jgi:Fe-Mn family superoxide dismutase
VNAIRLPPLPYGFGDLAPAIDELGVRRHYLDNHANYVKKYNALVAENPTWRNRTFEDVLANAPIGSPIYNNAAQAWAHDFWWNSMTPRRFSPPPVFDYATFVDAWMKEGTALFGSGWLWLSLDKSGKLVVEALPNAVLPQRGGKIPVLVMDLWEHAYYCQYGTDRKTYLQQTLTIINWPLVLRRIEEATP